MWVSGALLEAGAACPVHALRVKVRVSTCVASRTLFGELIAAIRLRKSLGGLTREVAA